MGSEIMAFGVLCGVLALTAFAGAVHETWRLEQRKRN